MIKRLFLLSSVLFGLLFCVTTGKCFAESTDVSAQLEQAEKYESEKKYEQAEALYRAIVADYPNTGAALEAQGEVVVLGIRQNRDVQNELEQLIIDYSQQERSPTAILYHIGRTFEKAERYEEAIDAYERVLQFISSENSHTSRVRLYVEKCRVMSRISANDKSGAAAALDRMLAEFTSHEHLHDSLFSIAHRHQCDSEIINALGRLVDREPERESALHLVSKVAAIYLEKAYSSRRNGLQAKATDYFANAAAVWQKIMDKLPPSGEYLARAHYWAGCCYFYELADKVKGLGYYQEVVNRWPESEYAWHARLVTADKSQEANAVWQQIVKENITIEPLAVPKCQILSYIETGNHGKAMEAVDELIQHLSHDEQLVEVLFAIDERYYYEARLTAKNGLSAQAKDYYVGAAAVCERIIWRLPSSSEYTPRAHFHAAVYYSQELVDYLRGIEHYQEILNNWPDYDYVCYAQYNIGKYYKRLRDEGKVSENEANAETEAAWQAVIDNYPECSWRKNAYYQLAKLKFEQEKFAEAAGYYLSFIDEYGADEFAGRVLYHLGRTYEKMDDVGAALAAYEQFLKTAGVDNERVKEVQRRIEELKDYT